MDNQYDIVITGGGLNGPAIALALADGGFRVALVDKEAATARHEKGFDGRGYALALGSQKLLNVLGVWPKVAENAEPILDVHISDGNFMETAPWSLHFQQGEIDETPMGYVIEDRYLSRALTEAITAHPNIDHLPETSVLTQEITSGSVSVGLDTGANLQGLLLIGADGRQSGVASRAGIKRNGWSYDQTALVCALQIENPHHGCAYQHFLPGGPLALLPLPDNHFSIVWSEETTKAAAYAELDDDAFLAKLEPLIGAGFGKIALAGKRFSYPLGLSLANEIVAERIALIGDAAHGIHPIAGQGLNLGLRDVGALAETLIEARRRGEDIGSGGVLIRYQQWRRWETSRMALATDSFNRLFSNDSPGLRLIRGLGMSAVESIPSLKRAFIREAAGVSGDLPKLLRGQQI